MLIISIKVSFVQLRLCSRDAVHKTLLVVSGFAPGVTPWLRISGTLADTSSLSMPYLTLSALLGIMVSRRFSKSTVLLECRIC